MGEVKTSKGFLEPGTLVMMKETKDKPSLRNLLEIVRHKNKWLYLVRAAHSNLPYVISVDAIEPVRVVRLSREEGKEK